MKNLLRVIQGLPCSGRPATSRTPATVECVRTAVNQDRWLTVQELEADLGVTKITVSEILTQNFGMKHVVAEFVPQFLQYQSRSHIMLQLLMIWFKLLPMNQIWCPLTSGFSQNYNNLWKGRDFRLSMRFRNIQWAADGESSKGFCSVLDSGRDTRENHVRSQGAYFEGDWGVIVLCTVFLISYIFFNKSLYFA